MARKFIKSHKELEVYQMAFNMVDETLKLFSPQPLSPSAPLLLYSWGGRC